MCGNCSESGVPGFYEFSLHCSSSDACLINNILGCILNVLFAICGASLNSLVIACFWKSSHLKTKVCYFLIKVLSYVDVVVSLVVHPLFVLYWSKQLSRTSSVLFKRLAFYSLSLFCGLSAVTLFVMSVERYLAIRHVVFHKSSVTKTRLFKTTVILFALWTLKWIVTKFIHIGTFFTIAESGLFFIVTIFAYTSIFWVARKSSVGTDISLALREHSDKSGERSNVCLKKKLEFIRDLKLLKSYMLILTCLFVLYLPNAVMIVLSKIEAIPKRTDFWNLAEVWCSNILVINSTVNSLIFVWKNNRLRSEARRILNF